MSLTQRQAVEHLLAAKVNAEATIARLKEAVVKIDEQLVDLGYQGNGSIVSFMPPLPLTSQTPTATSRVATGPYRSQVRNYILQLVSDSPEHSTLTSSIIDALFDHKTFNKQGHSRQEIARAVSGNLQILKRDGYVVNEGRVGRLTAWHKTDKAKKFFVDHPAPLEKAKAVLAEQPKPAEAVLPSTESKPAGVQRAAEEPTEVVPQSEVVLELLQKIQNKYDTDSVLLDYLLAEAAADLRFNPEKNGADHLRRRLVETLQGLWDAKKVFRHGKRWGIKKPEPANGHTTQAGQPAVSSGQDSRLPEPPTVLLLLDATEQCVDRWDDLVYKAIHWLSKKEPRFFHGRLLDFTAKRAKNFGYDFDSQLLEHEIFAQINQAIARLKQSGKVKSA